MRDRFREIAADALGYVGAAACPTQMTSGQRCLGCVTGDHPRCRRGVVAFVPPPFIGHPSSAILACPRFFAADTDRPRVVVHELAHLQTFAALDTHAGTAYYGCPVAPVDAWGRPLPGPGLIEPTEISGIADAYACFARTFRSARRAHRRAAEQQRRARETLREVLEGGGP